MLLNQHTIAKRPILYWIMPYGLRLRRRRNLFRYNVCEAALIFLFWALLGTETQLSHAQDAICDIYLYRQLGTDCNTF